MRKRVFKSLSILLLSPLFFCECSQAQEEANTGIFEYREIYLPEGVFEVKELGLNSVDNDWGIWGHHLDKVLPKNHSMTVYAQVKGQRVRDQFCFSSEQLFGYIENYIDEHYSKSGAHRFAILPNDNALVCQCELCQGHGNTATNASPAVFHLIKRLAERFPEHIFFTSYYQTTKGLPEEVLPANTGVLVSAMDFPLSPVTTPAENEFEALLKSWHEKISRVYVWDYVNNFDDYFTPYPILDVMQHRIRLYERCGVNGIFLNGSGTEYSTLTRIKTYVLADLLKNPHADMKELILKYCHQFYPVTGDEIASYIFLLEATTSKKEKPLPMYQGVEYVMKSYFLPEEFSPFHMRLLELLPQTTGLEKNELSLMCQAFAMTRLEIKRINNHIHNGTAELLDLLWSMLDTGVVSYSETFWSTRHYVKEYREMIQHDLEYGSKNLLKGKKLVALTPLDEDYNDISILTDGLLGLPHNYHCGQMISSATPALRIAIPHVDGMKKLRVSFTVNAIFKIALPLRVQLTAGGKTIGTIVPKASSANPNRSTVEFDIPSSATGDLVLTVVRNPEVKTMALDEIEGF